MDLHGLLLFFAASLLLGLAPGPDNLFVLAQSLQHGRRAGLCVTAGLCTGLLGHTAAVAGGLAALLRASPLAFTVLKGVGAAYLFWLAWQAWRGAGAAPNDAPLPAVPAGRLYRRGIVMNLTNPKVSLFFLAFLPQFVAPARGRVVGQTFLLGALFILATILVFGAISLLAGTLGERLHRSARLRTVLPRGAALVLAGLALRLAVGEP